MEWGDCQLLAVDLTERQVVWIHQSTGELIAAIPFEDGFLPAGLTLNAEKTKACMPAIEKDTGTIFIFDLSCKKSYRLPLQLPAPQQCSISPDFSKIYFSAPDATLYEIQLATLTARPFAQPDDGICAALAVDAAGNLYTAWESNSGGTLAVFSPEGLLSFEQSLDGIPTNLHLTEADILVPFTESSTYGEGLAIFPMNQIETPVYLTVHASTLDGTPRAYPCHATVRKDQQIAYLVNEDSASITVIHLQKRKIIHSFSLGRSITSLYLLPDERFAIAASNMFADLAYIDLINGKLLSIAQSDHEFSRFIAVL